MNKKLGEFYTPKQLSLFVVKHLVDQMGNNPVSVLEPSVGDGVFFSSLHELGINIINAVAVDIENRNFDKISKIGINNLQLINQDFLKYKTEEQFSLILGNPPYIKKSLLSEEQIALCEDIYNMSGFKIIAGGNIWTAFILKSVQMLSENGILAFILPSEILQVKFAKELMTFLEHSFERIEIITFKDLYFECKGQDTMLFIGYKQSAHPGIYFGHVNDINLLENIHLENKDYLSNSNFKWIHHNTLTENEFKLIEKFISKIDKIDKFCTTSPGIVTAANDFFIINNSNVKSKGLTEFAFPILQKSSYMPGSLEFSDEDFYNLRKSKKPSYILQLEPNPIETFNNNVRNYLKEGENQDFVKGYKCSKRKYWYSIPNFPKFTPSAFVFKRCHYYPKIFFNSANVYVTDSAYQIFMNDKFDIKSFICSFYNSLTMVCAELYGRHYGGGVLELTPSEFKSLPLPYLHMSSDVFDNIVSKYKHEKNLYSLIKNIDQIILKQKGISDNEIMMLESLHNKLFQIRTNKKANDLSNNN